jgi:hypothetical protein
MLARNRQEDHELMDQILQKEGREGFARAWFEAQGFPEAAAQVCHMREEVTDAAD